MSNGKKEHSSGELLLVLLIVVVGFVIIQFIGPRSWSLFGALGLPDWATWVVVALVVFGVIGSKKSK